MGNVDRLRITVDNEPQTLVPAPALVGMLDADRDWEPDGPDSAVGIRQERTGDDIFVVALAGEHDLYTAPQVQQALRSAIAAGARTSVVDLTETTFLDSTMLHVLLSARSELRDGRRLLLVTDNPTIKRVFEITGTDRLFEFFPSRDAAAEEVRSA